MTHTISTLHPWNTRQQLVWLVNNRTYVRLCQAHPPPQKTIISVLVEDNHVGNMFLLQQILPAKSAAVPCHGTSTRRQVGIVSRLGNFMDANP